ncbi:hypothetical protein CDA63_01010 [Hymenobacter amundsenii]|uniref:DUF4890 domain-containing protein n=1 Tax=Hymenobacter amundsenii TaxID=2006685 RepID=A0A246FQF9_9BACT|nr:hypothetical protein [Hymenobacter amundsenii]OWP64968.1 hypothetical protein CDA63_01010 [Hymenobacter amundsenii]
MKKLLSLLLLTAACTAAHAQTAVLDGQPRDAAQTQRAADRQARKRGKASATDITNVQRRMSMNADEAKRDQQLELLEARSGGSTANTSFGRAAGPARQYDKGSGGFTVRKYKDTRIGTARQKRGQTRPAGFTDPKGKPLKNKSGRKKHFLFF